MRNGSMLPDSHPDSRPVLPGISHECPDPYGFVSRPVLPGISHERPHLYGSVSPQTTSCGPVIHSVTQENHHRFRYDSEAYYWASVAYHTSHGYTLSEDGGLVRVNKFYTRDSPPAVILADGWERRGGKVFCKFEPNDDIAKYKSDPEFAQFFTDDGFVDRVGFISAMFGGLKKNSEPQKCFNNIDEQTYFCSKRTLEHVNLERGDENPQYEYVRGLSSFVYKGLHGGNSYHVNFLAKPIATNQEPDIFFAELIALQFSDGFPDQVTDWCIYDPEPDEVKEMVERAEGQVIHPEDMGCPCNRSCESERMIFDGLMSPEGYYG